MDDKELKNNEEPRLSRSQYREQQRRAQQETTIDSEQQAGDKQEYSREQTASYRHEQSVTEKTDRLKKKLNIAIVALVIAIIIVYLILFYVG